MAKSASVSEDKQSTTDAQHRSRRDRRDGQASSLSAKDKGKHGKGVTAAQSENASKSGTGEERKKKRKRASEGGERGDGIETADERREDEQNGGDKAEKRAKKKNKVHRPPTPTTEPEPESIPEHEVAPPEQPKKRKRKDKGKQRADATVNVPIDPQLSHGQTAGSIGAHEGRSNNPSDDAFITAVVAAASATSDPQNQSHDLQGRNTSEGTEGHLEYPTYTAYSYPTIAGNYVPTHPHPNPLFPEPFTDAMAPQPHGTAESGSASDANTLSDAAIFEAIGLNLQNNEDLLRALQESDITKIANVLRSLGDAASASIANAMTANTLPSPGPSTAPAAAQPAVPARAKSAPRQASVPSALLLGQPSRNPDNATLLPVHLGAMGAPSNQQIPTDPEHQYLLANKWVGATKLGELAKTKGLIYKKGKFSASEELQLKNAIETFRFNKGLTHEQVNEIIFAKDKKGRDNQFWSEITGHVPGRPIIAVYHHVRRTHHPLKQQGKWMPAEDDSLIQAVAECGQSWEKVSEKVGRMAADCRDRWRNHLSHRATRTHGQWSKEEEELLTQIVTEMTIAQGKDQDNDVFWGIVAQRMDNTRSRQQCRIKWTDSLSKLVKNEGQRPRWSPQDAYILVHKIASLNVHDDSEIDWKTLPDGDWNLWSAHSLQRRWLTLKRSIKGYEDMSHQEIVDILRVKKAHIPPAPPAARKPRVTSSATVTEPLQAGDEAGNAGQHQAHAGPNTLVQAGTGATNVSNNMNVIAQENSGVPRAMKDVEEDIGSSSEEEEGPDQGEVEEAEDGTSTSSPSSSSSSDEDSSSSSDGE